MDDPSNPAEKVQGLYMQLELSDQNGGDDDEELDPVELTLIPLPGSEIKKLFEAVSNCSNLHPDPMDEDEDMEDADGGSRIIFEGNVSYEGISGLPSVQRGASDGGLPPPFPGSSGWITAENLSEYFDADGNWIAGEIEVLGEGAGRTRTRDEMDGDGVNGHDGDELEDKKRTRTD
jgi:nucleotide-sensitive chloride channel 1A